MPYEWAQKRSTNRELIDDLLGRCTTKLREGICRCPIHRAAERIETLQSRIDYLEPALRDAEKDEIVLRDSSGEVIVTYEGDEAKELYNAALNAYISEALRSFIDQATANEADSQ